MPINPYETPRNEAEGLDESKHSNARYRSVFMIMGSVFAGVNLLTFLSMGVREILVYFDPVPALLLYFVGFVFGMALVPVLIHKPNWLRSGAWSTCVAGLLILLEFVWLLNVFVGAFCRDANWNFYWPWEDRDAFRLTLHNYVNLSQYVWCYWLDSEVVSMPWLLRESPGFVVLALWLVGIPLFLTQASRSQVPKRSSGYWSLLSAWVLIQVMALLPLTMAVRKVFNLKYLVALPEIMLNI